MKESMVLKQKKYLKLSNVWWVVKLTTLNWSKEAKKQSYEINKKDTLRQTLIKTTDEK